MITTIASYIVLVGYIAVVTYTIGLLMYLGFKQRKMAPTRSIPPRQNLKRAA